MPESGLHGALHLCSALNMALTINNGWGRRLVSAAAVSVLSASFAMPMRGECTAAEMVWPTAPYDYVVVDQDLRTVLQQFGTNTGIRIVLSDAVQGKVRGRLPPAPPRDFLIGLAQMFGLDWYYDGAVLSISSTTEAQTHLLPLQGVSFDALRDGLAATGLLDPRFQLKPGLGKAVALVSGPPHYWAMVQQAATALQAGGGPPEQQKVAAGPQVSAVVSPKKREILVFRGSAVSHEQLP